MSGEGSSWRDRTRTILAAAAGLAALAAGAWLWFAAEHTGIAALSVEDAERFVQAWGVWSWLASVLLMVLHSFLPLPAELIPIVNGMLFGNLLGVALTWVGAMLGAIISYALARYLGRPFVRVVLSRKHWQGVEALPVDAGALLLLRLVPLISFNLVNYAAGLLGVPWWRFLWTTALGILPLTILMVLLGGQILAGPPWLWAAAGLVIVALCLWYRRSRFSFSSLARRAKQ